MDKLRTPFFIASLVLILIVVSIEIGGGLLLKGSFSGDICSQLPDQYQADCQGMDPAERQKLQSDVPGLAITYMAEVDGTLLFVMALIGISLIVPGSIQGRLQGCATLIFTLLMLLGAIGLVFVALGKLLLMIALFLSVPFGTIAYFIMFGFFNRGGAAAILATIMTLKIACVVCLLLAQQRFVQNIGLVLLILTAFVANIIVSFLHGLVPIFLVSITDALAAIVLAIIAIIWLLVLLIGAIPAIIKAIG